MIHRHIVFTQNFVLFSIYFSLCNHLLVQIASFELLTNTSDKEYTVSFLSTAETQSILLLKCCHLSEVLDKNGTCVPSSTNFQSVGPLSLERRLKRAIKNSNVVQNIVNETLAGGLVEDAFVLRFKFERPACSKGTLMQLSYNSTTAIQMTASLQFVTNNFLDGKNFQNRFLIVDTKDYCIDTRENEEAIVVEFCVPESIKRLYPIAEVTKPNTKNYFNNNPSSSSFPILLRKCCPPSHVIEMVNFSCVRHDIPWQLYPIQSDEIINPLHRNDHYQPLWNSDTFTNISEDSGNETGRRVPLQVSWLTGTPNCEEKYEVYTDIYDRYYVSSEGLLITEQNGTVAKTPPADFCIEAVLQDQNSEVGFFEERSGDDENRTFRKENKFSSIFSRQTALVCFESTIEPGDYLDGKKARKFNWRTLYAVLTGISSVFLLITCLIYVILRKELKLPGWLQFAYSFSLLITFTLLTIAQLWTQAIHDISKSLCRALGYGLHFSFLVCFFYLTSMNFEIFSSFRSITLSHGFGKGRGKRRFLEFTAFSIGFPAAITALLLAVDSCNPDDKNLKSSLCILPTTGIGVDSCVFDSRNKVAQFHYFYGVVGILLLINLVIFVCTLISLRNRERETRMAKRQSTSTCDYDRLQLFTRLFLIMGILWIFEVISWLFQYFEFDEEIQNIFVITDCLNASQGFAVFLMFVWKRQTWKHLKKKFQASFGLHKKRPLSRPNGTISSNNTNGTSVKSSHLSSTKSRDLASTSTATAIGAVEVNDSLKLTTKNDDIDRKQEAQAKHFL